MRRFAEFLYLLWICKFCDHANRVALRKRMVGDFPSQEEYDNHKPYACFHCGCHDRFELREARIIERVIEANGDR
jgi:RNase P subunit RPR2